MKKYPPVLDVCCGPRMMWFDKQDSRALFQDKRDVEIKTNPNKAYKNGKIFVIKPDIKGTFEQMEFPDHTFKHVVFDPPHFLETDPNSKMLMRVQYGQLEQNWKEIIKSGFAECFRVLERGGTLVFKWNEYEIPVTEILKLTNNKPLYGHRSGKQSKTHWLVFIKE
jgi:ubiquinone/menaquinone biosynthesis C-methylase UbiE